MWEDGDAETEEWFGKKNTHSFLCIENLKKISGEQ